MNINDLIDDRYRIERKIGEGGMSVVYGATDIITKKPIAIKIIKGDMMGNPELKHSQQQDYHILILSVSLI